MRVKVMPEDWRGVAEELGQENEELVGAVQTAAEALRLVAGLIPCSMVKATALVRISMQALTGEGPEGVPTPSHRILGKWMTADLMEQIPGRKTHRWRVSNRAGITLGVVEWQSGWRQYVFVPSWETIYAASCLRDLAAFVQTVNDEQKRRRDGS